jgi:hypothetical protein
MKWKRKIKNVPVATKQFKLLPPNHPQLLLSRIAWEMVENFACHEATPLGSRCRSALGIRKTAK